MYLSKYVLAAWLTIAVAYMILSLHRRRQVRQSQRELKHLERAVQKLRRKNGKLWYELMGQTPERTDLTVTRL